MSARAASPAPPHRTRRLLHARPWARRLLVALAACLLEAGAARPAESPLELRLPLRVIRALASPAIQGEPALRREILVANPWAARVQVLETPDRFEAEVTAATGEVFRLDGRRSDAYRLLLGETEPLDRILSLPPGTRLAAILREADAVVAVIERLPPAPPPEEGPAPSPLRALRERSTLSLRLLGSRRYQVPTLGSLNPDNRVLDLPRHTTEGEVRVDATLDLDRVLFSAKPRVRLTRDQWGDGPRSGESETDEETLLLEGTARIRLHDTLFVNLGRENLQWGPAQLVNPSNPFFAENGRENPVREIAGMDFVRVVWLPTYSWTVSWIANTGLGEGNLQGRDWHPSQALKVEYVGYEANGGVLVHGGPDHKTSLRAYGRWTASDALLVYAEGSIQKGTEVLYPTDGPAPLGLTLDDTRSDDPALIPFTVLGASYTMELGPTFTMEYAYNGEGYDDGEAGRFFDLAHGAGALIEAGLLEPDPDGAAPGLRLLRRHYLFGQYLHSEIADRFTVLLRWTQNLDDLSGLGTAFLEWNASDRWRLFSFAAYGTGGNRDEFGSAVRWLGLLGIELSAF